MCGPRAVVGVPAVGHKVGVVSPLQSAHNWAVASVWGASQCSGLPCTRVCLARARA